MKFPCYLSAFYFHHAYIAAYGFWKGLLYEDCEVDVVRHDGVL